VARSAARVPAGALGDALLDELRERLGVRGLAYADPPRILADGATARAFAFRLSGVEGPLAAPLVARVFDTGFGEGDQTRVEAELQNALADRGIGAPRVLVWGDRASRVGAPYLVLERAPGRNAFGPLAAVFAATFALAISGRPLPLFALVLGYWAFMTRLLTRLHSISGAEVGAALASRGVAPERVSFEHFLAALEQRIEGAHLQGLRPAMEWLRANAPPPPPAPVVCHGDFWFGNVMLAWRRVTLLDWTQACLATPELDLGWMSIQHDSRLPLAGVPEWVLAALGETLRPFAWVLMGANRLAYRLVRPVDDARLRYFTAYSALRVLVDLAQLRVSTADGEPTPMQRAWGSPRTVARLCRRLRVIAGLEVPPVI